MERRQVYRNADGIRRTLCWDDVEPGRFHILTEQDVEPILLGVARDRELFAQNGENKVEFRIPAIVFEQAVREQWEEKDWERWRDGDGRYFKVWKGQF